jgi:hypothetical protein
MMSSAFCQHTVAFSAESTQDVPAIQRPGTGVTDNILLTVWTEFALHILAAFPRETAQQPGQLKQIVSPE